MPKWNPATIQKIEQRSPTVRSFWLELPHHERLTYQPGQFVTLELPVTERRRDGWRSYSIAAAPNGSNQVELCVVQLPDGKGSTWLFEETMVGTQIMAKDPGGVFKLPPTPLEKDIVFICTGTGVAPFRAMLQERLPKEKVNFHLIFGCRTEEDILYREEFEAMAEEYDNFHYSLAISRQDMPSGEGVETTRGYVHAVYEQHYPVYRADLQFYLCGWSEMVDEAKNKLAEMGYGEDQVLLELYG
ncbi:ferredoxin--NADP reductase [Neolewinella antarctica]|uniref:CDP-4-dehydro-6-deoxyglucose reductase n=1 Tax=Neolewinella antarctica TaxID=442734 RepID=A0ABX0XGY9_9BACT|nr:FAD-binding oxidoreductase [Neolewinella antarctica]NJC28415.1 CDP-4-dehydro-6-deoxyglucose reductase [Neolewinella antarctica]